MLSRCLPARMRPCSSSGCRSRTCQIGRQLGTARRKGSSQTMPRQSTQSKPHLRRPVCLSRLEPLFLRTTHMHVAPGIGGTSEREKTRQAIRPVGVDSCMSTQPLHYICSTTYHSVLGNSCMVSEILCTWCVWRGFLFAFQVRPRRASLPGGSNGGTLSGSFIGLLFHCTCIFLLYHIPAATYLLSLALYVYLCHCSSMEEWPN